MPPRRLSSSLARPFNDLSNYIRPFLPLADKEKGISHKQLRQRRASGAVPSSDLQPSDDLPLSDSYPSVLSELGDVRFGDEEEDEPERRSPRHSTDSGSALPFSAASTSALSRSGSTADFPFSMSSSRAASPSPSLPLSHALRPRTGPEAKFALLPSPPTPPKQQQSPSPPRKQLAPTLYETCPTPPSTAVRASRVLFAEPDEFGLASSPPLYPTRPPPPFPIPRAQSMPLNISRPRPLRPISPRPISRPPASPASSSLAQPATLTRTNDYSTPTPPPLGIPPSSSSQTLFSYDLAHLPAPDTPRETPYRVRPSSLFLPSFLLGGGRGSGEFGDPFGPIERKGEEQRAPRRRFSLTRTIGKLARASKDETRGKNESLDSWVAIVVE